MLYALLVLAVVVVLFSLLAAVIVACRKTSCFGRAKAKAKSDLEANQMADDQKDRRDSRASRYNTRTFHIYPIAL